MSKQHQKHIIVYVSEKMQRGHDYSIFTFFWLHDHVLYNCKAQVMIQNQILSSELDSLASKSYK